MNRRERVAVIPWHYGLMIEALDWLGLLAATIAAVELWCAMR